MRRRSKWRSTAARPFRPSRSRNAGSSARRRRALAKPAASPGATSSPAWCSWTTRAASPSAMSTTGRPVAMASYSFDGTAPGMYRTNGTIRISACKSVRPISLWGRGSKNRTFVRPRRLVSDTSAVFSGPSPTSSKSHPGCPCNCSAASSRCRRPWARPCRPAYIATHRPFLVAGPLEPPAGEGGRSRLGSTPFESSRVWHPGNRASMSRMVSSVWPATSQACR